MLCVVSTYALHMITIATLEYLISAKIKDAEVLLRANRHAGAIYLMGYALELSLKRRVCITLGFVDGFPETRAEMARYITLLGATSNFPFAVPRDIALIRHHDLGALLSYSGIASRIATSFSPEWALVSNWNPELRYHRQRTGHDKAKYYVQTAKRLIDYEIR
jgi:hypothetical protein